MVTAYTTFDDGYHWPVLLLLAVTFLVVASGNTLFGGLRWAPSRVLGEISYSIYLLHGLLLFAVLQGVLGPKVAAALPNVAYWGLIVALVPVLVLGAFATFRFIERPAIRATPHAQRWLAARLAARTASAQPLDPEPLVGGLTPSRP